MTDALSDWGSSVLVLRDAQLKTKYLHLHVAVICFLNGILFNLFGSIRNS